jgi:hypothetical protein
MPSLTDLIAAHEPPQPLTRALFHRALALHGFAMIYNPFGIQFRDRRARRLMATRPVWQRDARGWPYMDRLATLQLLLRMRREQIATREHGGPGRGPVDAVKSFVSALVARHPS